MNIKDILNELVFDSQMDTFLISFHPADNDVPQIITDSNYIFYNYQITFLGKVTFLKYLRYTQNSLK